MIYLALIRGINVGGKNIIRMPMLKQGLNSIGFLDVKTYIQSGNVILKTEKGRNEVRKEIEAILATKFFINTTVIVRTIDEINGILEKNPFANKNAESKIKKRYICFLESVLTEDDIRKISLYTDNNNQYVLSDNNLYLFCENGIRDSKLTNALSRINASYTMRNWDTTCKIAEIAKMINKE